MNRYVTMAVLLVLGLGVALVATQSWAEGEAGPLTVDVDEEREEAAAELARNDEEEREERRREDDDEEEEREERDWEDDDEEEEEREERREEEEREERRARIEEREHREHREAEVWRRIEEEEHEEREMRAHRRGMAHMLEMLEMMQHTCFDPERAAMIAIGGLKDEVDREPQDIVEDLEAQLKKTKTLGLRNAIRMTLKDLYQEIEHQEQMVLKHLREMLEENDRALQEAQAREAKGD
jgi:hypothetical protein